MPTFDLGAYLANTDFTLDGIVSTSFPKGKAYTFPSPSAKRGMWMRDIVQAARVSQLTGEPDPRAAELVLDGAQEMDLYREVMGDTLDELLTDGVPWVAVQRIFGLLFRHYGADRDIRTELQEAAEIPAPAAPTRKQPARKRTARKAPARKADVALAQGA